MAAKRLLKFALLTGLTVLLISLPTLPAHAQTPVPPQTPQQPLGYDEAEAYAIDGMLMCPVCPAETIDQAQVPLARQMRQIVREKLAQGQTRQEILDFFAQRYGQAVIAAPPKSGFNLVAWVFPVVAVLAALTAGVFALRSMTRPRDGLTVSGAGLPPCQDLVDPQPDPPGSSGPTAPTSPGGNKG